MRKGTNKGWDQRKEKKIVEHNAILFTTPKEGITKRNVVLIVRKECYKEERMGPKEETYTTSFEIIYIYSSQREQICGWNKHAMEYGE